MDRRKKSYLAVIGLGLIALVVDRTLLRPDAEPDAASAAQGPSARPESFADAGATIPLHVEVPPFPRDLPDATLQLRQRDPFALSRRIEAILTGREESSEDGSSEPKTKRPGREQLRDQRRLSAVVRVRNEWVAIIDGLKLTEGQVLDDCRLIQITTSSVLFDCWDGKVLLSIQRPSLDSDSK